MAVSKENTKYSVQIIYKTEYDTAGDYPDLPDYTGTFTKVKETANITQLLTYAQALMNLTAYKDAPYRVDFVEKGTLVVE